MIDTQANNRHSGGDSTERPGSSTYGHSSTKPALPVANALLEVKTESESPGSTCALLTPMIKAKQMELDSGQVLEVRVSDSDSTVREDIEAWCRLSGNELLAMRGDGHRGLRFFLRKK